jgi:tryptophan 2,3-dioxygenase
VNVPRSSPPGSADPPVTYGSYLALDELLGAQRPRTGEHDELLFIVIHQVYELWFKQLLHEGARLQQHLASGRPAGAMRTLGRMLVVLKTIVGQVDVLETMTPSQFGAFRAGLDSSSGFQSAQFRELEILLGRRDSGLLRQHPPGSAEHARLAAAMARPSLLDSLLGHLAAGGYPVPPATLSRDVQAALEPSAEIRAALLAVYRDDGLDAQLCDRMVDLDEGMMEWRYRHVQMVRRMIGDRPGTGGSAGVGYLASTLMQPAFADLWAVRSEL